MLDVVSIGSATEDVFVYLPKKYMTESTFVLYPGSKVEIEGMDYFTGGGATNTSVALSRLGLKAGIVCAVGKDESGNTVMAELEREGVNTRGMLSVNGRNTAYSVILTAHGKDRIVLYYSGATAMLDHAKIKPETLDAKWLYITSLHSEPVMLRKIASHATKAGTKIAFNPGQVELGLGVEGIKKIFGKVSILFLNSEEALKLTGSADIHRNLRKLGDIAENVVITEGKHGAHCADGANAYSIKPYDVPIKDVTGAGDAFGSGFTAAIMKGRDLQEAMEWGTANASSVVMHTGTKNVLLTERKLKEFVEEHSHRENRVEKEEL